MRKSAVLFSIIIFCITSIASIGGAFATWFFAEEKPNPNQTQVMVGMNEFLYFPEDMPDEEISALQRLTDILNNKYTTDKITNSRDYLINETIQVYWGGNIYADPYVGSMDANYAEQINELFKDVLFESNVSFILKNQDLNGDGYKEIAMYSTSDPLDCVQEYDGVVCVYVSVFTPVVDERKNVIGYTMVCESLRGYCSEVFYDYESQMPSFSTDEWRDDIGYWDWYTNGPKLIPEGALSIYGDKDLRHDYDSYNKAYQFEPGLWGSTVPYGKRLWECLSGKIPYI